MQRIQPDEFWPWAFSDFLGNALRGVLAEYIVARSLGPNPAARVQWDAYDFQTEDGLKIEVKSSAYLQSWEQKQFSTIRFDIAEKRGWDAVTDTVAEAKSRCADVYVFCVFAEQDPQKADPLLLEQWFFLVCLTLWLNEYFAAQKTVGLATLEAAGLQRVSFPDLAEAIRKAAHTVQAASGY